MARWLPATLLLGVFAACSDVTRPPGVTAVEVKAPSDSVEVGKTLNLDAVPVSADGEALARVAITWTSSNESVASVDASGEVTGRAVGTARIQASASGKSGEVTIRVIPTPVATVSVLPDTATLLTGSTRRLAVVPRDAAGGELTDRAVAWSSDDTVVASVAADGTVTARDAGTAVITAESGGKRGTAKVTVVSPPVPALRLERFTGSQLPYPVYLTSPPGDDRRFVVGVKGQVWVVDGDQGTPELFLDLTDRVEQDTEMGMYSIAFHPRYASNGYFYVDYTDRSGRIRVERYTVSRDLNRADPGSMKQILAIDHPPTREHYGGIMQFGADGKLYVAVGDGGHGYSANAQDPGVLLGKILRIDVDAGDPYAIPADNPFVGRAGARGEIWALGLRNPWRFSFDRVAGLLYVADVGENDWEEVNVVPAGQGGLNYGWGRMEGAHCYPPGESTCDRTGLVLPVLEYAHPGTPGEAASTHPAGCSITGGFVYRGSRMPGLRGHYFYGDLCRGWVRSFRYENGRAVDPRQWSFPGQNLSFLLSFGEDSRGELYLFPYSGIMYRIVPAN
ncbi:MAG: PQQ-dependent sugar dehydrogenase [Gemmatimonadetes bacterium]|nr:PQQ-dependent sugar dehydrogenase [Gemmatimonadota bacterium]